jgi:hypothetical protein
MISSGKGTRLVDKLVKKGFVRKHKINITGEKGGLTTFLELTDEAYKALGMTPRKGIGIGAGFVHGYYQYRIATILKDKPGIENIMTEGVVSGKAIDVLAYINGRRTAIEIAMRSANELNNIQKDVEAGCLRIIIACVGKKVLEEISEKIEGQNSEYL